MAKRNDFMTGFLQGLYQSGLGNPEVQRANDLATQTAQATLNQKAAAEGMVANTLPNDHPAISKIGNFISSTFGGPSTPLQTAFKPDPSLPVTTINSTGTAALNPPGYVPKPGEYKMPVKEALPFMKTQANVDRSNIPFDTARSMATLSNKPGSLDAVIAGAQKEGRDYLTKNEMDNAFKAISTGAMSERGDYFKQMVGIHQGRLDLANRQAAFGKSGYGANQISLNTALQHASSVQDGLQNLNNTNVELLNVPINQLKEHTNDPGILSLNADVTALSDELSTAFKGSSGTDIQMQEWAKTLKTSITPDQARALIPTISDLLDARLTNLERQQKLVAPSVVQTGNILSPTASAARAKITANRNVPGGTVPTVNSQAEYDALPPNTSYMDSHGVKAIKR